MASDVGAYKMQRDVQEVIRKHIEEAKEEVVKLAVKEFETRIRQIVGATAINIAEYYSVQMAGPNLVITVKLDSGT
jgi:hypothetical protein